MCFEVLVPLATMIFSAGSAAYGGYQQKSAADKAQSATNQQYDRAQQDQAAYLLSPEYRASQDQMWLNQNMPTGTVDVNAPASGSSMIGYGATDMGFIPGAGELLSPENQYPNQYIWA